MLDTNKSKKAAWGLNKQVFPKSAKYYKELNTFFHQEPCNDEAPVSPDSEASKLLTALLSVACVTRHGRSYIVDSGASHHLISFGALTDQEQKPFGRPKLPSPYRLRTNRFNVCGKLTYGSRTYN